MRKIYNILITVFLAVSVAVYMAVLGQELLRMPGRNGLIGTKVMVISIGGS